MNITSPGFSVATTNAIHQQCQSEAIANNTTVSGGMEGIHVTTDPVGVQHDYGQCIADHTQISQQAQEKPQATIPSIGTESQQPTQGIGSTVSGVIGGIQHNIHDLPTKGSSSSKKPQSTKPNQEKPQDAKPKEEKPQSAWQNIVNIYHGISDAAHTVSNVYHGVADTIEGVSNTVSTVTHAVIDPITDVAQILEETTTVEGLTHPNSHQHNYQHNEDGSITVTPKK